ncbi:MAG: LamG domain-containing protein, partial [Nanoarchaeota archaeon]|nr:LamG domain-containing protein [Nanoarchaeota archaeon]
MKKEIVFIIIIISLFAIFVYAFPGAPSISGLFINASDNANNKTTANLTINFTVTDPDGNNVKNITVWYYDLLNHSLPVLYLPFENNSNASLTEDYSSYHNNGNVSGAVWNMSVGYDGFGAYNFTTGNYISTSPLDALVRTNHTYGGWVKLSTFGCVGLYCMIMQQADAADSGYEMFTDNGGNLYCYNGNDAGQTLGYPLSLNNWYHIMCWHNDTKICLYVNGVNTSCGASTAAGTNVNFVVGGGSYQNNYWFNGTIDEVYVFNRSLSAEQIKFLYENRTDILSSSETSFDEYWHASVTPVDSTQEKGEQVNSSYIKINHLAPFFYNITFFNNITSTSNKTGIVFNGSATIGDLEGNKLNISFTWYENGLVLISNNTVASNMSNITNGINGTMYYTTQNLTNLHYRSGYNY